MVTVQIGPRYTVTIPEYFRSQLRIGQRMAISVDAQGRLVLTPLEQARTILDETFGIWAGRADIPKSGIKYMDKVRRGHRLKDQKISRKK
jgi:bifunctional DNA-binding transcriptional regulator/antitoxin component of YhaV-PrlF toxin-antitoxin module